VYWTRLPRSVAEEGVARLRASSAAVSFPGVARAEDLPGVVDDAEVTTEVDGTQYAARKAAAMRAHATQITVEGEYFALSNNLGQPIFAKEYYQLAQGDPRAAPGERENDLFAGVSA
jgi:N-acetyl-1-D-myo-inositol-2-amino-2-deoxy-alpha-D-glucopyranoside deacetylase